MICIKITETGGLCRSITRRPLGVESCRMEGIDEGFAWEGWILGCCT